MGISGSAVRSKRRRLGIARFGEAPKNWSADEIKLLRMLDSHAGLAKPIQREKSAPPASSSGDTHAAELLSGGHQSRAFQWLVSRLFSQNEVEFAIGNFLAQHPKPSRQDIDLFTNSLPANMRDDVEDCGWNTLTLAVDQAVLNAIRDPGMQDEIMRALNIHRAAVVALVDRVRRTVFCRKSEIILAARMAGYYAA